VIEEGVSLKAVLVLEVFADLNPLALDAPVSTVGSEGCVTQEVEAAHRHL
jgi:hypothetical protein